jgi:hypothetical protein
MNPASECGSHPLLAGSKPVAALNASSGEGSVIESFFQLGRRISDIGQFNATDPQPMALVVQLLGFLTKLN